MLGSPASSAFVDAISGWDLKLTVTATQLFLQDGIANSPLSPFLDQELLYNNSTSVDGSFIESTGFEYKHPALDLAVSVPAKGNRGVSVRKQQQTYLPTHPPSPHRA